MTQDLAGADWSYAYTGEPITDEDLTPLAALLLAIVEQTDAEAEEDADQGTAKGAA